MDVRIGKRYIRKRETKRTLCKCIPLFFKNGVIIPGASGNTLSNLTVSDIGTYHVVYTAPTGCTSTSASIAITGQQSNNMFVYPVPNNGNFTVQFYNQANEQVTLIVINALGQKIYERKFTTTTPYSTINVNLSNSISDGTYIVQVINTAGQKMGERKIIVGRR